MCVCVCMYVCMYIWMCVCVLCVCVCMYVYTHTFVLIQWLLMFTYNYYNLLLYFVCCICCIVRISFAVNMLLNVYMHVFIIICSFFIINIHIVINLYLFICICLLCWGFSLGFYNQTIWEREREMFYLMMHSTHFIYGYMVSDIWLRTILIVRKETCCRHIGYSSINSKGSFICTIP